MKKLVSISLCCLLLIGLSPMSYATASSHQQDDINMMSTLGLNTQKITNIKHYKNYSSYQFNYQNYSETLEITKNQNSVTLVFSDGNISNEVIIVNNGDIYLDGTQVKYDKSLVASGWKSIYKGFSPYGSLTKDSYSKFLASGTQDISLGKSIDAILVGTFTTIIGATSLWAGITVSIAGTAASVYNTMKAANPKTTYLGCKYKTYVSGSADYKYICDYYENKNCVGKSKRVTIYEHFRVY